MKYRVKGFKDINTKAACHTVIDSSLGNPLFEEEVGGIETNILPPMVAERRWNTRTEYSMVTLEDLAGNRAVSDAGVEVESAKLELKFDKTNLSSYAYYGPLTEVLDTAMVRIIKSWNGSLFSEEYEENGLLSINIYDYRYDKSKHTSTFKIPVYKIENKYGIYYGQADASGTGMKDIVSSFRDYVLYLRGNEYPLVSFRGIEPSNSSFLYLEVWGNPLGQEHDVLGNFSERFHVKPSASVHNELISKMSQLERHLLGNALQAPYSFTLKVPFEDANGNLSFEDTQFEWPCVDGYNIDSSTVAFETFYGAMLNMCTVYDESKTNLIVRMMVPPSLMEMDRTDEGKVAKLLKTYGRSFDEIKRFIDGLTSVNTLSYDRNTRPSSALVKNLASTLGWEYSPVIDGNELLSKVFNPVISDQTGNFTPAELDIEVWNRILVNTSHFFKGKGTRHVIESILALIGAPEELVEYNEYVYLADGKVKVSESEIALGEIGYPVAHRDMHYHNYDDVTKENYYIERYIEKGFNLTKVVDNKKSWAYEEGNTLRIDDVNNTRYTQKDSRLVINSKEVGISISPLNSIEKDVYAYSRAHGIIDSSMTFLEYMDGCISKFVSAKNRKTLHNPSNTYPLLNDMLLRYMDGHSNPVSLTKALAYAKNIETYWKRFVMQLIPATTIITQEGVLIRNSVFTPQRHIYQKGISAGSEFETLHTSDGDGELMLMGISAFSMGSMMGETSASSQASSTSSSSSDGNMSSGDYTFTTSSTTMTAETGGTTKSYDIPAVNAAGLTTPDSPTPNWTMRSVDFPTGKRIEFFLDRNLPSGYTMGYQLYKYSKSLGRFESTPLIDKTLVVTNRQADDTIPFATMSGDSEYLVSPYFIIEDGGENFNTKKNIDNIAANGYKKKYGIYEPYRDLYFLMVATPNKPFVTIPQVQTTDFVITETVSPNAEGFYVLGNRNRGVLGVTVGGVEVAPGDIRILNVDSDMLKNQVYNLDNITGEAVFRYWTNGNAVSIKSMEFNNDYLAANYNPQTGQIAMEVSDEIFENDFIVTMHSMPLTRGVEYEQSNFSEKRVYLKGDSTQFSQVSVLYVVDTPNDFIWLTPPNGTLSWEAETDIGSDGYTVVVTTDTDAEFNSPVYTKQVPKGDSFRVSIPMPGKSDGLLKDSVYRIKIRHNKVYTTIGGATIKANTDSDFARFKIS
jgi:hypothetical protein